MPTSAAMAGRCSTALVDPPMAAWTLMAFSKAARVRMALGRRSRRISSAAWAPASAARWVMRLVLAGIMAFPGRDMPRASAMACMVLAVPMY